MSYLTVSVCAAIAMPVLAGIAHWRLRKHRKLYWKAYHACDGFGFFSVPCTNYVRIESFYTPKIQRLGRERNYRIDAFGFWKGVRSFFLFLTPIACTAVATILCLDWAPPSGGFMPPLGTLIISGILVSLIPDEYMGH